MPKVRTAAMAWKYSPKPVLLSYYKKEDIGVFVWTDLVRLTWRHYNSKIFSAVPKPVT